jgi:hypothetical protein
MNQFFQNPGFQTKKRRAVNFTIDLLCLPERGILNPPRAARKSFKETPSFTSLNAATKRLLNLFVANPLI